MAKILGLGALLLVSLLLIAGNSLVAGDVGAEDAAAVPEDVPVPEVDIEAVPAGVATQTFGLWKPWFPFWQPSFCAWDYWTTGVFEVVFDGAVCSQTFGRTLAGRLRTNISNKRVGGRALGTVSIDFVQCSFIRSKRRATFTMRAKASKDAVALLRTKAGRSFASAAASAAGVRAAGAPAPGAKFFSSVWITDYWCSGCVVEPAPVEGITYDCELPAANGDVCAFTCDNGDAPVEGTEPVCTASAFGRSDWTDGEVGPPECGGTGPTGCGAITEDDLNTIDAAGATIDDQTDCSATALEGTCAITCSDGATQGEATCGADGTWDFSGIDCSNIRRSP